MSTTDTRIIKWLKENLSEEYESTEKNVLKVLERVQENAPKSKMENLIYWILINYYTYEVVQSICEEIEKNSK